MSYPDIVVVGASAGGIEALKIFVAGLPANFPGTVLIVLHIPAHSRSCLDDILSRETRLPVRFAKEGDALVPGHIFIAPTDRHLLVTAEGLRVTRGPRENRARPAIDVLFRSAAYSFGGRVIGIVLSGMLDDGTAGLWAIKDQGGITLVQSPDDAEYGAMPQSALEHVRVDHTLPVAAMPALLAQLMTQEAQVAPAPSRSMAIETSIGLEGNALQDGIMMLGEPSPNTCPECHGVLIRIVEGTVVRYRCHTGHAYSLQTLLTDVNDEVDRTLWAALRTLEERILLLREMQTLAERMQEKETARHYAEQAKETKEHVTRIRDLVLSHTLFDEKSKVSA